MFRFLHGYLPGYWEAQVRAGLVGENDGIRFCEDIMIDKSLQFNELAKKGGALHKLISDEKRVFYVDRLQGGTYIEDYPYDPELLCEYERILGDKFWGFQIHEWMSNYRHDVYEKLGDLPPENWTEEEIKTEIFRKFSFKYLFLEAATAKEMEEMGRPGTLGEFYKNITDIYRKRMKVGELLPCDSAFLAYGFELSCGAKRIMPEVGAQTADARVQISYARGMTRGEGKSFGVYYEPWGGAPFSTCCYQKDGLNEWGIGDGDDFPFKSSGDAGGSSRSLQKRIFLYGFLSGAEFISEEWGVCNTFHDWNDYELSPYGKVKKDFLDFTRRYTDIGDKLTPIAAVLPSELYVLDNLYDDDLYCGFKVSSEALGRVKKGIRDIFSSKSAMLGNETRTLKNSLVPDAVDLVNYGVASLERYKYLVDLTEGELKDAPVIKADEVADILRGELPCYVEGCAHWLVNECFSGGYYLTVFNHSGVLRTVKDGEVLLSEASVTLSVSFKGKLPVLCEGDGALMENGEDYTLTLPAGGYAFIRF